MLVVMLILLVSQCCCHQFKFWFWGEHTHYQREVLFSHGGAQSFMQVLLACLEHTVLVALFHVLHCIVTHLCP